MTLSELLPSLRTETRPTTIAGIPAASLAARFGTPTYVLDEHAVRRQCRTYRETLPDFEISYAGKALLTTAVARWMVEEGLGLDVCSEGELAVARRAGVPPERTTMHGNAKTKAMISGQVGTVVIDSFDEIDQLTDFARRVLVRVTPGVDGHTHRAVATGVEDQKFGFSLRSGAALEAVGRVLANPALTLAGLHCHLGSQITRVACFEEAARRMVGLLAMIRDRHGVVLPLLNLGGGHADHDFDLADFARRVHIAVNYECERYRLPAPALAVEPGRAIVARAGVTLYRVLTVKHLTNRTFVAVDGGMSDNPRPALYGARYTVELAGRASGALPGLVTVAGRHCESGDLLAIDVPLPGDVHAGDLLAVPGTGAYHHSMASNYNLVGRPPLVSVRNGEARVLVRRETEDDLLARDTGV